MFDDAERFAIADQMQLSRDLLPLPMLRMSHFARALAMRAPATGTSSRVGMADVGGLQEAKRMLAHALGELVREKIRFI